MSNLNSVLKRRGSSTILAVLGAMPLNSKLRSRFSAHARRFHTSLAAACVLGVFAYSGTVLADIVNVKPNVANDVGNWTTTVVDEFQIRLNGYTGYETTGIAADTIVDDKGSPGKVSHPQHIVRLPNALGPDGQWHAYFAITHSGDFTTGGPERGGDGYWLVAEIDAEDYDHLNDRITTNSITTSSGGSEGRYVYEDHFTTYVENNLGRRHEGCWPRPCLGRDTGDGSLPPGKAWYSEAGDWNHPAAMATMGDAMLMVAQQFPANGTLLIGKDPDALLFYDVSEPWMPKYVGKFDVCALGLVASCGGPLTGDVRPDQDIMSTIGLAHFENGEGGENGENGWYHLSVGNGSTKNNNFYCDSGADCFKAPLTIGTPTAKWKNLDASLDTDGNEVNAGGQQGQIIHSREMYASNPGPGEPCYFEKGGQILKTVIGEGEENTFCSPPGVRRAIRSYATAGGYTSSFPYETGGFEWYVQGKCWPYTRCTSDTWWSYDLSDFRSDSGIPIFLSLGYKKTNGDSVLSPGPDAYFFDGGSGQYRRTTGKNYEYTMTQLTGECGPNNGSHVNDNGEVIIYCVSESWNEPIDCPDGGECNRIFSNRANGARSYGVIKFTNPQGKHLTYRGRGLRDTEILNEPPWGPGRRADGSLKDPEAVDWKAALSTPGGATFEVISGEWLTYPEEHFGGPEGWWTRPMFIVYRYGIDIVGVPNIVPHPPFSSLRVMPEQGIALFDGNALTGRMVSAVESVPNLVRYCGDDFVACMNLYPTGPVVDSRDAPEPMRAMDGECEFDPGFSTQGLFKCTWPRTIRDKTLSTLITSSAWTIYGDENFNTAYKGTVWKGNDQAEYASPGGRSIKKDSSSSCSAVPQPTGLSVASPPYGDGRPLLSWDRNYLLDPVTHYNVIVERQDGAIIFDEVAQVCQNCLPEPKYRWMPKTKALRPGETYNWSVRGIYADNDCYVEGKFTDKQSVTIENIAVEINIATVTNDPLGLGTGTIGFAPGSALPASDIGANLFGNGSIVILVATAAPDSEFVGWAGDAATCNVSTTCTLTISANLNIQAVFRPKPRLFAGYQGNGTVTVDPLGFDCSNSGGFGCNAYSTGTVVNMTAAAVPGKSNFVKWAGDADCTDNDDADGNPLTSRVTLSESKACTAVFARSNYLLEATTATSGGSVSASDAGGAVTCDPSGQICTKNYTAGIEQTATLTATADGDFRFVRWSGSEECWSPANNEGKNESIDVTVGTTDIRCRAVFVDLNGIYTLNVQKQGTGSIASKVVALVTAPTPGDLPEINCALPACTTEVPSTASIQLTATPVRGARFDGWYGSDPLCELPPIQIPDPDNPPFTIDVPDPNPVITIDMADVAALGGDLSCRANFSAKVLLVDGSDGDSLRSQYVSEFNKIPNIDFDEWSVRSPNSTSNPDGREEPNAADLANYSRVIWYTGAAFRAGDPNAGPIPAGPSPAAEAALGEYLDGGGCLMLSSAEYVGDRGLTSFAINYLGASAVNQDVDNADPNVRTEISGAGLLPGFSSFGRGRFDHPEGTATSVVAKRNDAIVPSTEPGTQSLYSYSAGASGVAGVGRDNGVYRTAFLGFPIMAMPFEDPTDTASEFDGRGEVIGAFLDHCLQIQKDDDFEANDDGEAGSIRSDIDDERATRLQGNVNLTDLKILPGNDDWYRWETTVKTDTKFEILFSHDSGDLNFDFYEGNRRDPSDSIQSTDDNEIREWFTFPGQAFYLRVYGVNGATNSYSLKITSTFIDTDSDGISNLMDDDDDGDGMSDQFEVANGLDPLLADDANFDEDNDGFTNLEESQAGTDLRDPESVPTAPATLATNAFFNPPMSCSPSLPRYICAPVSLPWLGILLGD